MGNKLERKLLDQVFYEVARQCVDFEHLLWFEQDLVLRLCEEQKNPAADESAAALVRKHVNRAWKRVEAELHRQRADLQMAIFHDDPCPICNDNEKRGQEPFLPAAKGANRP
jgi:hypothetical protein